MLLAAQPTRGVDVGAIEFIHARLREARDAGKAMLLVSADLTEVLALADRIAVMYGGRIVDARCATDASEETLGAYMTGATRMTARSSLQSHGRHPAATGALPRGPAFCRRSSRC